MRILFLGFIMSFFSSMANSGQIEAGFAKLDITPEAGEIMITLAAGEKPVSQIQDPLYVKVLVLSDGSTRIALLVIDSGIISNELSDSLSRQLVEIHHLDHVIISATHTHSGLFTEQKLQSLIDPIAKTVAKAGNSMQPVKLGGGQTRVDLSYNRIIRKSPQVEMLWTNPQRQPNREVDDLVGILNIQKLDNEPLLTLVNYNAHPVVTMDLNRVVVSGDYPAYLSAKLKQLHNTETMFMLGAAGDINPYDANTAPIEEAINKAREMGEQLAEAVSLAIQQIDDYQQKGRFEIARKTFLSPKAKVGAVMLTNELVLAHFPGEYFDDFGLRFKQQSGFEHPFFISMSNGYLGYVPTIEAAKYGGYGADVDSLEVEADTGKAHLDYVLGAVSGFKQPTSLSN